MEIESREEDAPLDLFHFHYVCVWCWMDGWIYSRTLCLLFNGSLAKRWCCCLSDDEIVAHLSVSVAKFELQSPALLGILYVMDASSHQAQVPALWSNNRKLACATAGGGRIRYCEERNRSEEALLIYFITSARQSSRLLRTTTFTDAWFCLGMQSHERWKSSQAVEWALFCLS